MNNVDAIFAEKKYRELRAKGIPPIEAVLEIGFSEEFADSAAHDLENKWQKSVREAQEKVLGVATGGTKKGKSPMDFLLSVMNDEEMPIDMRTKIANQLMPYFHARKSAATKPVGKKEEKDQKASEAASGKFRPATPPKLAAVQ